MGSQHSNKMVTSMSLGGHSTVLLGFLFTHLLCGSLEGDGARNHF